LSIVLTWSTTNGGTSLTPLDLGNKANGQIAGPSTIYIRHSGSNPITQCAFYINQLSSVYTGGATAVLDFAELKEWGDANIANDFGGIQLNQNATGSFPSSSWPTVTNKVTADGKGAVSNSSQGSTSINAINLLTSTGASIAGEIPNGASPNVRLQLRAQIPTNEAVVGIRQFELVLRFTFTS
jgi:hypothetical protein